MVSFLKFVDNMIWKWDITGWKPPKVTIKDKIETLKLEKDWSKEEAGEALGNFHALISIYNGVDNNMLRIINKYTSAKKAWETLETAH